jgi:hypothetical protein
MKIVVNELSTPQTHKITIEDLNPGDVFQVKNIDEKTWDENLYLMCGNNLIFDITSTVDEVKFHTPHQLVCRVFKRLEVFEPKETL